MTADHGKIKRAKLPKMLLLRRTNDFKRVYAARKILHDRLLLIFYLENGLDHSRFGISVGKKHGKAVRRNRIKRLMREAWRLNRGLFPAGFDYILIPRKGAELNKCADVIGALTRAVGKMKR